VAPSGTVMRRTSSTRHAAGPANADTLEVADFFLGRAAPFYLNLAGQYAQTDTQWAHAMGREMEFKFPLSQQLTRMVDGELDESGNERPLNVPSCGVWPAQSLSSTARRWPTITDGDKYEFHNL
jgi:hypothetical protein